MLRICYTLGCEPALQEAGVSYYQTAVEDHSLGSNAHQAVFQVIVAVVVEYTCRAVCMQSVLVCPKYRRSAYE